MPEHCHIVGAVAQRLIALYPPALQSALFPPDAAFAAACHDIGKISPTFYNKLMHACGLPQLPGFAFQLEREWGGHAGVSQVAATAPSQPASA